MTNRASRSSPHQSSCSWRAAADARGVPNGRGRAERDAVHPPQHEEGWRRAAARHRRCVSHCTASSRRTTPEKAEDAILGSGCGQDHLIQAHDARRAPCGWSCTHLHPPCLGGVPREGVPHPPGRQVPQAQRLKGVVVGSGACEHGGALGEQHRALVEQRRGVVARSRRKGGQPLRKGRFDLARRGRRRGSCRSCDGRHEREHEGACCPLHSSCNSPLGLDPANYVRPTPGEAR